MKETNGLLEERLADSERALEEMGQLFSSTKLELDSVRENVAGMEETKVLDKQSQLMNSPCGDPNKELNHKEENQ